MKAQQMMTKDRVLTGDCREVLRELAADSISACITDPPYNYEFIGHKWNAAEVERRLDRIKDSKTIVKNIPYGSGLAGGVRNARWYKRNFEAELKQKGLTGSRIWKGWHSCFRNEWEAIVVVQKPLVNNYVNTVMEYGVGLFHAIQPDGSFQSNIIEDIPRDKNGQYNIHCTVKPLALMEKLVDLFVPPSKEHIVLDPFAGSGTTLVAARNLGRSYIGIEVVSEYVMIIEKRLAEPTTASPYTPTLWPEDKF